MTDTKKKISRAAAELFYRYGYQQTTLRMIAEQVGITHASIMNHFESKVAIAAEVVFSYIGSLSRTCNELWQALPAEQSQDEQYYHLLYWTLNFKLLSENPVFRKFVIAFSQEGPILMSLAARQVLDEPPDSFHIVIPAIGNCVSVSLLAGTEATLTSLIDLKIIDYRTAANLALKYLVFLGIIPRFDPPDDVIESFAEDYLADLKIDILNDFMLQET